MKSMHMHKPDEQWPLFPATPPPETHNSGPVAFSGTILRIAFYDPVSCYAILNVRDGAAQRTVTGYICNPARGCTVFVEGKWTEHQTYGEQVTAATLHETYPQNQEQAELFLAEGLGGDYLIPHARALAREWRLLFNFDLVESHLCDLLPSYAVTATIDALVSRATWIETIRLFHESHIDSDVAQRILREYGTKTLDILRRNPYAFTVGSPYLPFDVTDRIGHHLGFDRNHIFRIDAGMLCAVRRIAEFGHTCTNAYWLTSRAAKILQLEQDELYPQLPRMVTSGLLDTVRRFSDTLYGLPELIAAVKNIARETLDTVSSPRFTTPVSFKVSPDTTLSEQQLQAVTTALACRLCIITGGPGVGKTTVVKTIIEMLPPGDVILTAPTGKAAKRLAEVTGIEAATLHRVLEYFPPENRFRRNETNPFKASFVIIDESSMLDVRLTEALFAAIPPACSVVIVGDADQIPSVGPGNVLADLIESGMVPTVKLTEIFRQAEQSQIIVNAHRINRGLPLAPDTGITTDFHFIPCSTPQEIERKMVEYVTRTIPGRFGCDPVHDIQVITPMNKSEMGTSVLNGSLQALLNKRTDALKHKNRKFKPGDKVVQLDNNYDKNVFNGNTGTVLSIDRKKQELVVNFDDILVPYQKDELDQLGLAYAMTVHKCQGSEFKAIIVLMSALHGPMLERNLLYTAVTRGREFAVVIGETEAVTKAIATVRANQRQTMLHYHLTNGLDRQSKETT